MKKLAVFLLCGMLAASLAACGTENGGASQTNAGSLVVSDSAQIPNPWTECSTLDEAEQLAGFSMTVPEKMEGYATRDISVIKGHTISVTDKSGDEKQVICFRKGIIGGDLRDISGNYVGYDKTETVEVQGKSVTQKGDGKSVSLATWDDGTYAYSINTVLGEGLSSEKMNALIEEMMESDSTQIPNPWTECSTLDEAMEKAGFYIDVPKQQDGYTTRNVSVIPGELISVTDTSSDTQEMCFRKGVGTEDVSGDYNVYEKTETVKVGASTVTFKGNGGLVNLAVWTDGADSYSIMVREQGIPQEQMQELVAALS